jgi:hypothetical protein
MDDRTSATRAGGAFLGYATGKDVVADPPYVLSVDRDTEVFLDGLNTEVDVRDLRPVTTKRTPFWDAISRSGGSAVRTTQTTAGDG